MKFKRPKIFDQYITYNNMLTSDNTVFPTLLPLIPFVAPASFDASAQAVNIHKIYSEYAGVNKAYGYSFSDTVNTLTLAAGTGISYTYGYTRGGVDYTFDVASVTNPFTATIDTKRWVIVNNTASGLTITAPTGSVWIYLGKKCSNITSSNNSSLKYLHIETTLNSTLVNAFLGGNNLIGGVTIPSSMTNIGNYSFRGNLSLNENLVINSPTITWGAHPFAATNLILNNAIGSNWEIYDKMLFFGTSRAEIIGATKNKTGALTIPSSVTVLRDAAFFQCSGLIGTLTIPSTVITFGGAVFYQCTGFTGNLTIPSSIAVIPSDTFNGCSGFNGSLDLPAGITSIGNAAFTGCTNFTALNLANGYNPAQAGSNWTFNFSNNFSAASLNQSILNIAGGGNTTRTITIGATNKARLLASYPNAETDANARGITIV